MKNIHRSVELYDTHTMDSLSAPLYVPYDLTPFFLGQWEHMTVQHWGVLAGVVTYCLTVTVVVVLLILGGTCTRLREQAEAFERWARPPFAAPFERFQLYDELLDAARTLPLNPRFRIARRSPTRRKQGRRR